MSKGDGPTKEGRRMNCAFCGMFIIDDAEMNDEDKVWRYLCFHVWQHHDERDVGISLRQTLRHGPQGEEE